ncbi:hypothetical protein ACN9MB_13765 [Dyella kyungheensis]|jgi:hypothetical protein|uniref:hypothetical protein n=1 Tax=Dyella kyungheensis TaxID=1242174 RepID=UPI003CF26299
MKRRHKRRIVRTLLTVAAVGGLLGVASWHRWHRPVDEMALAEQTRHQRQIASCEAQIRPTLQGEIEGWRLVGEESNAIGSQLTFAANFNARTSLYHCEVDHSAQVVAIDGPE